MTLFVLVALPLLVGLGLWQLERAAQMRWFEDRFYDRLSMLAQAPQEDLSDVAFKRITLVGEFEPQRSFLLDNQVYEGEVGYWVITPFATADHGRWLINRGWLSGRGDRAQLPAITAPAGPLRIVGVLWPDTGLPPLLADDPWPQRWPIRVQRMNVARMAALLDGGRAYEVRLESGQPGMLTQPRLKVTFSPTKNVGYAVQWFLLTTVLLFCYIWFGFRRGR